MSVVDEAPKAGPLVEGWEDPLQALLLFHGRIRAALATLHSFVDDAKGGRVDAVIARALHDFFVGPLRWHDDDEEISLLPRLERSDHPPRLERMLESVSEAHDALEALVEREAPYLAALASGEEPVDVARLASLARELDAFVSRHLSVEEQEILPLARLLLDEADLEAIRAEMTERLGARRAATGRDPVVRPARR